jgi:hypothetical protein
MSRSILAFVLLAGCAHHPISSAALGQTKSVALLARVGDDAGPIAKVFRSDGAYGARLKARGLDEKDADAQLSKALTVGSFGLKPGAKKTAGLELLSPSISRFEIADSLRATLVSLLPQQAPWIEVVAPGEVARVLESLLVQEAPGTATDVSRLSTIGVDTVVEIVVEEYGLRSEGGKAGAYLVGSARMYRLAGGEVYRRDFFSDDLKAGLEPLDALAVLDDASLFASRIKQMISAIALHISKDLTP